MKKLRQNRQWGKKTILIVGLILFIVCSYFIWKTYRFYKGIQSNRGSQQTAQPTPKPDKHTYSFLMMGYGGPGHDGAYLTDTMMLIYLDTKLKRVTLISLPRDIRVQVPTTSGEEFYSKINAVYQMGLYRKQYPAIPEQYGGEEGASQLVKKTVEQVTGIPVDYFISINFDGFKTAVDMLGGVDVNVATTFDDYEYPAEGMEDDMCGKTEEELPQLLLTVTVSPREAFPCRYEHLHFDEGVQHMDGTTALKYVRSRHSLQDGNDFGRAARQQRFLEAVKDKVVSIGFIPKIIPLMDEMQQYIRTDIPLEVIQKILAEAPNNAKYKRANVVLSDADLLKSGSDPQLGYILQPRAGLNKWEDVHASIYNVVNDITPTPTKTATASATVKPVKK